jgi:hypothetical protein
MHALRLLSLLLISTASLPALAQTQPLMVAPPQNTAYDPTFSRGEGAIPALPLTAVDAGGLRYVNGGVGDEELAQLKAQKEDYNLRIMLSAPSGAYISDVKLRLLDTTAKELLVLEDAGPYVYVKLPAGTYHLETTNPGEATQTQTLTVPHTGAVSRHIIYNQ